MVSKRNYQAYAAAMQTMANTRQVVVLYDGILRYLNQAVIAMREKNIMERYHNLVRASEIVFGLQGCLDFERGGDIARILYNFYASADARIFALHRSSDVEGCEALIVEFRQMREVWDEIDRNTTNGGGVSTQAPAAETSSGASDATEMPPPAEVAGTITLSA